MAVRLRSVANRDEVRRDKDPDRILDVAEPALHAIAAEHGLREARIDRWRWDQPEVVLSWVGHDRQNVARSIRFYIDDEGLLFLCSVEVNAWRDERDRSGRWVRRWRHKLIGSWQVRGAEEVSADHGRVSRMVGEAYDTVAEWDVRSLSKRHYPLQPGAAIAEG